MSVKDWGSGFVKLPGVLCAHYKATLDLTNAIFGSYYCGDVLFLQNNYPKVFSDENRYVLVIYPPIIFPANVPGYQKPFSGRLFVATLLGFVGSFFVAP
jgi:hypothetical protein